MLVIRSNCQGMDRYTTGSANVLLELALDKVVLVPGNGIDLAINPKASLKMPRLLNVLSALGRLVND